MKLIPESVFEEVSQSMKDQNWQWYRDGKLIFPSAAEIKKSAKELIESARKEDQKDGESFSYLGSGGLQLTPKDQDSWILMFRQTGRKFIIKKVI